jgi:hypothetical protein
MGMEKQIPIPISNQSIKKQLNNPAQLFSVSSATGATTSGATSTTSATGSATSGAFSTTSATGFATSGATTGVSSAGASFVEAAAAFLATSAAKAAFF